MLRLFEITVVCLGIAAVASAADRTWIGGNNTWDADPANWSGNDEPDADDVAIFNTSNSVDLAPSHGTQLVLGLTMSGGISLSTNGQDMTVDGLVELSDASTDLIVDGAGSLLSADAITINSGADITLSGGQVTVNEEAGAGILDVNNGGELSGNGTILFSDAVPAGTQLFNLDGTLTAHSTAPDDILSLAFATLTINISDADGVIDLDGNDGFSTINVLRNDTLAINGGVIDSAYSGAINLSAGAAFSRNVAWSFNGTLNANTGGGAAATIAGADFTQTGGSSSINVDEGETLRFQSVFHATNGVINNDGLIIFDSAADIGPSMQIQTGLRGSLEINAYALFDDPGWLWDGGGGGLSRVITIGDNGTLDAHLTADDEWSGVMNINGGVLIVTPTDGAWGMSLGTINMSGNAVIASSAPFTFRGTFHVLPGADASFFVGTDVTWTGGGDQIIDGGFRMWDTTFAYKNFTGAGAMVVNGDSTFSADTEISVNTFDWDGDASSSFNTHTINAGVTLTIGSPNFDDDGDMDDAIHLAGNSFTTQLIVNGAGFGGQWIMNGTLTVDGFGIIGGYRDLILRGVLDVNGNTNVDSGVTFAPGSLADVAAGATLRTYFAVYDGALITGEGIFLPITTNIVQSDSAIAVENFGFDFGSWVIDPGATLTVSVTDYTQYDAYGEIPRFDITINSGTADVLTGAPEFLLNAGTLNLNNTLAAEALWTGEPLTIGDDTDAVETAKLNVGGTGLSRIGSVVTFNSDAVVNIALGAGLVLDASATFRPVNGASNASFTGPGLLRTNGNVNVDEATTFNMSGGTIDFDGDLGDANGNRINIDAPLVVYAANFESFGLTKPSGVDLLDINHDVGAGSLTVNLDAPTAEWTLNDAGVMNLINDNTNAVLLAGSDVNLNGDTFVTGEVQIDARADIGATGTVILSTAVDRFRLNGGNNSNDPNTIAGGLVTGSGVLAANDGRAVHGFGAIGVSVDFDGAANLLAKDGTLVLTTTILDVGTLGTADSSGVLEVQSTWNTNVADLVYINGGELRGGAITNAGANGLNGFGLISSRVINRTRIDAEGGLLIVQTVNNDNDWDGTLGDGSLNAISGDLEIRDNAAFQFTGVVSATDGRQVFANGFELEFELGSTLELADGARYRSTHGTHIGGFVMVADGAASLEIVGAAVFENGSTITLTGDLQLDNGLTVIEAGATFTGGGALINGADRTLRLVDGANVGALIENQGTIELGASPGQVQGVDFQQDSSGTLEIELAGTGLNDFDRLILSGQALLDGTLNVSLIDGFSPAVGNSFTFLSAAAGITGTFDTTNLPTLASSRAWLINYYPTSIQLTVIQASLPGDYNEDGIVDAADYVVWRKTDGSQAGYDTWRTHFGDTVGSSAGAGMESLTAAVPEPTAIWMVLAAMTVRLKWRCHSMTCVRADKQRSRDDNGTLTVRRNKDGR
jgi:autotransporter-associated beta strand protein